MAKRNVDYGQDFFSWIVKNSKKFCFCSVETKGVQRYLPGVINISVVHRSKKLQPSQGIGWGYSKYESLQKGAAEILEREFMHQYDLPNSNGCAVHVNLKEAKKRAIFELIERDAFFCHYLTSTPFIKLKNLSNKIVFKKKFSEIKNQLKNFQLKLEVYEMAAAVNYHALFVAIEDLRNQNESRLQFGTACSDNFESALEQALIEAIRAIDYFDQDYKGPALREENFNSKENKKTPILLKHSLLRLNAKYVKNFQNVFLKNKDKNKNQVKFGTIHKKDIKIKVYPSDLDHFERVPLYFVRAESKRLQSLYFGSTKKENINLKRLKEFKRDKNFNNINFTTHPFS